MPSGKTHAKGGQAMAGVFATSYALAMALDVAPITTAQAAALGAGLVVGILITPDIDIIGITYEERRIHCWFGGLAKRLWMAVWMQYAIGIRHRCPLSHAPIRGTLIRAAYLWPAWAIAWWLVPLPHWPLAGWMLAGWVAQDTLHWAMDWMIRE